MRNLKRTPMKRYPAYSISQLMLDEQDKANMALRALIISLLSIFSCLIILMVVQHRDAIMYLGTMLFGSMIIFILSLIAYIKHLKEMAELDSRQRRTNTMRVMRTVQPEERDHPEEPSYE